MRFFVPSANDISHGESVYQRIRERLESSLGLIKDRRIQVIRFNDEGKALTLAVGDSFRRFSGEPVIAIFEGENSYFVSTSQHGADSGEPFQISADKVLSVEDFTAIA